MPDFRKSFIMYVDASELRVGAVLIQEDDHKMEHPIDYLSQKFITFRNYCTSEKETLALIMALQRFEFYVTRATFPIMVYTDHNPLVFLSRVKSKNQHLFQRSLLLQEHNLEILDNIMLLPMLFPEDFEHIS